MTFIDELINYHRESNILDFKLEEYSKDKSHELIKDVIAFANADVDGDKYIIIGLKKSGKSIKYNDVLSPKDGAAIQQLLHSNVNPEIDVEYFPYDFDTHKLVILRIINPTSKPYEFKKNFKYDLGKKEYKAGTMFIRKGEYILPISRDDLEKIYEKRIKKEETFEGKIEIVFASSGTNFLELKSIKDIEVPSTKSYNYVNSLLNERKELEKHSPTQYANIFRYTHNERAIEQYRNEELTTFLPTLVKSLVAADTFFLEETSSHKLQFTIINNHNIHLKNVYLKFYTDHEYDGIILVKEAPYEVYVRNQINLDVPILKKVIYENYPSVQYINGKVEISHAIAEIKHKFPSFIFQTPIRIYFKENLVGEAFDLYCDLHAENLPIPIKFNFKIQII